MWTMVQPVQTSAILLTFWAFNFNNELVVKDNIPMVLNSYSEESYIAADVRKVKQNSRKLGSLEVANMIPAILALNHRLHVVFGVP